ncbi:MAG TPA: C39 family peptidase [Anaerolineales bacterium]|nr:C39 family peptidase [Anaerolineales bacterium]
MKRIKSPRLYLIILVAMLAGILTAYRLPSFQERVDWRINDLVGRVKYALSPPEQVVFIPQEKVVVPSRIAPSKSPTLSSVPTSTIAVTETPFSAPSQTATPIPDRVTLTGFTHEYQTWNNCGPATLGIALSFWGWEGDQQPIAAFTKPNSRDKNVMPSELVAFVEEETEFDVVSRAGGNVELLKRFLASGMPVIIEKGFEGPKLEGWMGHYVLVTGYSDAEERFTVQDSFFGPDQGMSYADLESYWRAFNFAFLVVYPADRKDDVENLLGPLVDEEYSYRSAGETASNEIYLLTGRDQFFAWFNRGTNLMRLQDYAGASQAYDQAFQLYPSLPEKGRPWRMMWYQTGPYWAYYYTGRYQDVINLATQTLDAMSQPVLEESYYWRALALLAWGDSKGAIKDLRSSLEYHPGFEPSITRLQQLESTP